MEGEVVRRRLNVIAAHFSPCDDISPAAAPAHLLPMHCSSSLNSVIQRRDNRMYFARQASASQGFFMRQASTEEEGPSSGKPGVPSSSSKCPTPTASAKEWTCNPTTTDSEEPLFARPANARGNFSGVETEQSPGPNFARPSRDTITRRTSRYRLHSLKELSTCESDDGNKWSPRMDVVESRHNYILTLEIPGVNIKDIRVEIKNQCLRVMGKPSSRCSSVSSSCPGDKISTYHRREIIQGPYHVVWSLPSNVNKERISAEFHDGFLQIIIPKL